MPNFKFEMTPGRRFAAAFWTGWAFHMATEFIVKSAIDKHYVAVAIISLLALTLMIIYTNNKVKFEKEFMWMTIKNPDKVGGDDWLYVGEPKNVAPVRTHPHQRPTAPPPAGRPPPPPAPPKKRSSLGGGR